MRLDRREVIYWLIAGPLAFLWLGGWPWVAIHFGDGWGLLYIVLPTLIMSVGPLVVLVWQTERLRRRLIREEFRE